MRHRSVRGVTCEDNTHCIDDVNTTCIATLCIGATVEGDSAERLRAARQKAGYDTAQAAADAFGWNISAYRHHENGTRGFDVHTAVRYGRAFKVNPGYLLALDRIDTPAIGSPPKDPNEIDIWGPVAAGVWREAVTASGPHQKFEVGPNPRPGVPRFAVQVDGKSMDMILPPGSMLECLRVGFGGPEPQPGDLVIVQRQRHNLFELTCKRLVKAGDDWELRAESSQPEFQDPIPLGRPDVDHVGDEEIRIVGIVVRSYQMHFRQF